MNKILEMVKKTTAEFELYPFYRAVYKATPCGPYIGFRINGEWVFCSDLPNEMKIGKFCGTCRFANITKEPVTPNSITIDEEENLVCTLLEKGDGQINRAEFDAHDYAEKCPRYECGVVDGISVGSIVEGSDAEVPPVEFGLEDFTEESFWKAVEAVNKAADYLWVRDNSDWFIIYRDGVVVASAHWEQGDDGLKWDGPGDLSEEDKKMIQDALGNRFVNNQDPLDEEGSEMKIGAYIVQSFIPNYDCDIPYL